MSTIRLSTGREIAANQGIIGYCEDLGFTEGYDTMLYLKGEDNENGLNLDEQIELANLQLEHWLKVRDKLFGEKFRAGSKTV